MKKIKSKVLGALIKRMMGMESATEKPCESDEMEGKEGDEDKPKGIGMISIAIGHGKPNKAK